MVSAGRILIMPKGNYDSSATYEMLDLVSHNGKSWLAKKTSVGIEPSEANAEYWQDMFEITAENAGAVQRTIWKWVSNDGDSLFSYIKSKLAEGYTCGMIQVEIGSGTLSDISETARGKVGTYFMCSFQRHHYDYVRATIWGDTATYEYSNWGVLADESWATDWTERMCPKGYLPRTGGSITGSTIIQRTFDDVIVSTELYPSNYDIYDEKVSSFVHFRDGVAKALFGFNEYGVGYRDNVKGVFHHLFGEHNLDLLKPHIEQMIAEYLSNNS